MIKPVISFFISLLISISVSLSVSAFPNPLIFGLAELNTKEKQMRSLKTLADYFETQHPAKKLWSLLHRNMSLILQRMGKRDDPQFMKQLFDMDIAYAQSLRLGATNIPNDQRKVVEELANDIDGDSRAKMART